MVAQDVSGLLRSGDQHRAGPGAPQHLVGGGRRDAADQRARIRIGDAASAQPCRRLRFLAQRERPVRSRSRRPPSSRVRSFPVEDATPDSAPTPAVPGSSEGKRWPMAPARGRCTHTWRHTADALGQAVGSDPVEGRAVGARLDTAFLPAFWPCGRSPHSRRACPRWAAIRQRRNSCCSAPPRGYLCRCGCVLPGDDTAWSTGAIARGARPPPRDRHQAAGHDAAPGFG